MVVGLLLALRALALLYEIILFVIPEVSASPTTAAAAEQHNAVRARSTRTHTFGPALGVLSAQVHSLRSIIEIYLRIVVN